MDCPTLAELPAPPSGKTGWPWLEETLLDSAGGAYPRITVVTPSYNQAQFIEETIRSVLLQGYPNLEYIIIDGGSTDETLAIIAKYAQWLACFVSEADSGQSEAINKGFALATGNIIAWLNSDDVYMPNALEQVAAAFEQRPSAEVIQGRAAVIDELSQPFNRQIGQPFDYDIMLRQARNMLSQPAVFMRRQVYEQVGGLNPDLHYALDADYWLRVGLRHSFHFTDQVLAKHRSHPAAKTYRGSSALYEEIIGIYAHFYQRDDLPAHIAALKPISLLALYLKFGEEYFFAGERYAAWRCTRRAFAVNRRALLTLRFWRLLVWGVLPLGLVKAVNRTRQRLKG